jgi:hypothetical protein
MGHRVTFSVTWRDAPRPRAEGQSAWRAWSSADLPSDRRRGAAARGVEAAIYTDGTLGGSPEWVLAEKGEAGNVVGSILRALRALGLAVDEIDETHGVTLVPCPHALEPAVRPVGA